MKDNKIVRLSFILFLVCAIVAAALAVVNMVTEGPIKAQADAKTAAAYAAVLTAPSYTDVEFDQTAYPTIDLISKADDGAGYVVTTTFSGAQGSITMIVGVSPENTCTGISITSHSETSGLGANAAADSDIGRNFRAQFVGATDSIQLADIEALSGATITSRSVTNAVATAIQAVESLG